MPAQPVPWRSPISPTLLPTIFFSIEQILDFLTFKHVQVCTCSLSLSLSLSHTHTHTHYMVSLPWLPQSFAWLFHAHPCRCHLPITRPAKVIPFYRPCHPLILPPHTHTSEGGNRGDRRGSDSLPPLRASAGGATLGREVGESSATLLSTSLICTIFALGNPRQKGHSVMHPIDRDPSSP